MCHRCVLYLCYMGYMMRGMFLLFCGVVGVLYYLAWSL
jgi:hypothetical protein